jgi:hypothetical protein
MAFTIASNVGSSMSAATGRSMQGHLCYAANQGAWWFFYLSGTNQLSAVYSTNNGASWTAPSGSPFTLAFNHNSEGRNFGFSYANIGSTDILHMLASYDVTGTGVQTAARFTLGSTWTNTNAEARLDSSSATINAYTGNATWLDSNHRPWAAALNIDGNGTMHVTSAANTDSGSSWSGYGAFASDMDYILFTGSNDMTSAFGCSLGSGTSFGVTDNASATGSFTNLGSSTGSATHGTWEAGTQVLSSNVTSTSTQNWGAIPLSTSDVHLVSLSDNTSAYVHRRFNGTSWANGDSIGSLTYGTNSGISLISDGTSVWQAAIDSSKNIKYSKWVSGTGWGSWTTQEAARTNTPAYITGAYSANGIMWVWTESTGTNYNLVGSFLSFLPAGGGAGLLAGI